MPLFSYNGRAFKFYLVNLPEDVNQEITKMIVENGGEIVDIGDPPIINFSVPDNYVPGKVMYNVDFIKDCVRWGELGDLHKYKLGPREVYDGCIMSLFMYENPSCIYRYVKNQCLRKNICPFCGSGNVALEIEDVTDSLDPLKSYSGTQKVINSEKSHKKGGGDATKCLKSTNQKHLSHLEHETEEGPSTYETAQDMINYSVDSNLPLTQATQNQIDELHTDSESTITIHKAKETVQLNSESPRSLKRADGQVKHKSPLDTPEIIHMSSDSESDQSGNSGKKNYALRSQFLNKVSHLSEVELIQVPITTVVKKNESHMEANKNKKEAETAHVVPSKLKRRRSLAAEKRYKENEKSKSRIRINPKYKNGLSNHDEGRSLPLINPCSMLYIAGTERSGVPSDEDEEYPRLNNGKSYNRRDGKRIRGKCKKDRSNAEKSCTGRKNSKRSSQVGKKTQENEDSADSVTDPEGIFTNVLNNEKNVLRPRKELPNSSYIISDDDLDDDDNKAARPKKHKSPSKDDDGSKHDNESDWTVSNSEMEISEDSDAPDNVKKRNNTAQSHARSTLHVEHWKNGEPVRDNVSLQEWLVTAKRKAESMEAPQRRNFAKWEKWRMLIFLIEQNLIDHAKGLDTWQCMLQKENCGQRTKMSLNNHFLKFILPHIEDFRLPKDIEKRFLTLRHPNI